MTKKEFEKEVKSFTEKQLNYKENIPSLVNYQTTKDNLSSYFIATCLLLRRVRSLTVAPYVYSQVPYEVFMSYTDNTNVQKYFKLCKYFWSSTSHW